MSSLKNAVKSQRIHKERHQPESRKHLGPLEKKKDYKVRAKDQETRKRVIKKLYKKVLNKNPNEFHYHMINSELKDGIHYELVEDEKLSVGNVTQDLTYVTHALSVERKKIEKLKAHMHILPQDKPKNTHILFVDSEAEAQNTTPAELLQTDEALLNRTFNRPRLKQLETFSEINSLSPDIRKDVEKKKLPKPKLIKKGSSKEAPLFCWPLERKK